MENTLLTVPRPQAETKPEVSVYQLNLKDLERIDKKMQDKINKKLIELKRKFDQAADRSTVNSSTISAELSEYLQRDVTKEVGLGTPVFMGLSDYLFSIDFDLNFPQES